MCLSSTLSANLAHLGLLIWPPPLTTLPTGPSAVSDDGVATGKLGTAYLEKCVCVVVAECSDQLRGQANRIVLCSLGFSVLLLSASCCWRVMGCALLALQAMMLKTLLIS